ncbi:adenylylsulfate kinase [Melghirimyces profundicolus]|uniref:Adenylyl-sulfate kinase n=1 Tax=Melghirimyces profundicolus TaxID=1242148 RepID=A0A2T6C4N7_9BACL|nr:adenylyl-sulfate kinase [Melghirimyces profundicolus]PTX63243.1 adenylylsulfate kinase [Melghirimyces profundicolus]
MTANIVWFDTAVRKEDRRRKNGHGSAVLWFTGLSGSGKSTLANALDRQLAGLGLNSYVLDGDNIRHGLNRDLGFSPEDRKENIRRIGEVAKLFVDSGQFALTAFISPYREDRRQVRELLDEGEFIEIYVRCPLDECERRDPKGLYRRARLGEIPEFTGVSAPYEEPESPELVIDTAEATVEESVEEILNLLEKRELIPRINR